MAHCPGYEQQGEQSSVASLQRARRPLTQARSPAPVPCRQHLTCPASHTISLQALCVKDNDSLAITPLFLIFWLMLPSNFYNSLYQFFKISFVEESLIILRGNKLRGTLELK